MGATRRPPNLPTEAHTAPVRDRAESTPPAGLAAKLAARLRTLKGAVAALAGAGAVLGGLAGYWNAYQAARGTTEPSRLPAVAGKDEPQAAASANDKSIAVLPFTDMSERKDQEYFSDGLSEELIERLSRSPNLRVIARTSSFYYKGKQATIGEIANTLRVSHVLEGSVRKAGDGLRVTAQLIRASDGTHLWSQTYDRRLSDIFAVQDDIAATVARALHAALKLNATDAARHRTNTEAYNLSLEADFFNKRMTRADTLKAIDLYKQAIKIDPNYAQAWVGLSGAHFLMGHHYGSEAPTAEYVANAHDAINHALRLDPNLAEAHSGRARLLMHFDWNWAEAAAEYKRALELGRNEVDTRLDLAMIAAGFGQPGELVEAAKAALGQNPLSVLVNKEVGINLFMAGRYDEAALAFRRASELEPHTAMAKALLGAALLMQGKNSEALESAAREPDDCWRLWILAVVYWALDRKPESDAALRRLQTQCPENVSYQFAEAHAFRGEVDVASAWLERAYREQDSGMTAIRVDPLLRNLHGDPRYLALVAKMKLDGEPPATRR